MGKEYSSVATVLRLWFVLAFSYLFLRFLFNLVWLRWIDANFRDFFLETLSVSFGQAIVLWFVTRRGRVGRTANADVAAASSRDFSSR